MSDLFTTLANEAVGIPMAVAPRVRSRFEAPSLPLNLASQGEEVAPLGSDTTPPRAASQLPETRAEPRESDIPQSTSQTSRTFSHERIHRVEFEKEIVSRIELEDQPVRTKPESARAGLEPVRPVLEPARTALPPDAPAKIAEPAHTIAIREDAAGHAVAAQVMPPGAPAPPQHRAPPQVETIPPRIVVPESVKPDAVARTQSESGRAQPLLAPRRQAAAPPAIHVTIGRVEVRAVTPPAAKPAPAGPKPVKSALSLADYLEQRNRSG